MDEDRIAERIYELIPPWDREDGKVKDVIEWMHKDPQAVMEFLLDIIDNNI